MDPQKSKLFIKVNGVIGSRKRICTFCNNTIEGVEKVLETTRKLRCGPYFPQLAYLQSAVGKIDTLGRAVVCLSCFHQLLRQWSAYEQKNVPVQRRKYTYVSDNGVKNYEETRALEILTEAEKRAFAIQTKQELIVKKSFVKFTKSLDVQEELIKKSEERIIELNREFSHCTKGEHWKINREIQKQNKLINAAEFRVEVEEDKEDEIRKQTKKLLEVYRNNQSLFRAVSEPNLFKNNDNKKVVIVEEDINCLSESEQQSSPPVSGYLNSSDDSALTMNKGRKKLMGVNEYDKSSDLGYHTITVKTEGLSVEDGYRHGKNDRNDVNSVDPWGSLESPNEYVREEHQDGSTSPEWHLVKEIVHPVESNSQSFPEDEWSKLLTEQRETKNQVQSSKDVYANDNWGQQNYASQEDLIGDKKNIERENKFSEETDSDDSEEEKEQMYEVNPEEWSSTERVKRNEIPRTDLHDNGKFTRNNTWNNMNDHVVETTQTYSTSNEVFSDVWDNIQIEKDPKHTTEVQSFSQEADDEENYTDEYDQDIIVSRNETEIISPGRLDTTRFSEFTKSSYVHQPQNNEFQRTEKYGDNNRYAPGNSVEIQRSKKETEVTIIEKRNNHVPNHGTKYFQSRNESVEPVGNNGISRERNLSVEEEEWERKHLSPNRLDKSKLFRFLNENCNSNVKKSESNASPTIHKNNNGYIKESNERSNKRSDSRDTSFVNNQTEFYVESSPAMRQLIRQEEIKDVHYEKPVQKMTTTVSLESDPWNDLDRKVVSQDSIVTTDKSNRIGKDTSPENNKKVGRLDLKQWSFKVDRNRRDESSDEEEEYNVNIKQARSEDHIKEKSPREDRRSFSLGTTRTSEIVHDERKSYKVKDDGRFMNVSTTASTPIQNSRLEGTNQRSKSLPPPNNLKRNSDMKTRSLRFNQSMSEDELAWEKRYNKSHEKSSSEDEDNGVQKKVFETKSPRLVDENDNLINLGKIVLDEEEVRRVRNGGSQTYIRTTQTEITRTIDHKKMHGQSDPLKYDDISQLREEEKAWEEKISTPGKLDFSKFAHFK